MEEASIAFVCTSAEPPSCKHGLRGKPRTPISLGGNIDLSGGNITWSSSNTPVQYQFSVNGTSDWHATMTAQDKYRRDSLDGGKTWGAAYQFRGEDGKKGSDANVTRGNIALAMLEAIDDDGLYAEYIDGRLCLMINATAIKTGVLKGVDIYGASFYDYDGKTRLVLNPSGAAGNYADLALYSGNNEAFKIYDNADGSVALIGYGRRALNISRNSGTYAVGDWSFAQDSLTTVDFGVGTIDFSHANIIWGENAKPTAVFA